jgi:hypothetical protein
LSFFILQSLVQNLILREAEDTSRYYYICADGMVKAKNESARLRLNNIENAAKLKNTHTKFFV